MPQINSITDLMSPSWFSGRFAEPSWVAWRIFLKALMGEPLSNRELRIFSEHCGGRMAPTQAVREALALVGRGGGKSQVAALIALHKTAFAEYPLLAPGETATAFVLASDKKQASVIFDYVCGLVDEEPALARMVTGRTQTEIRFDNSTSIEVHRSEYRSVRGFTLCAVLGDEIAFWSTDEESASPDKSVLDALRPALSRPAVVDSSLMLLITSPYARRGEAWTMHRDHFGHDSETLVWQGDTRSMNPLFPQAVIDKAYRDDPAVARAEYGALFRDDVESFISEDILTRAVIPGRNDLLYVPGTRYYAFTDPAGGSGQDSMTLAIAHKAGTKRIIDLIREVRPPFSPDDVVKSFADDLRRYNLRTVTGDRYAGEWPAERFGKNGVMYVPAEQTKSEIYIEALPLLTSGQAELPDDPRLVTQLRSLDRRTGRSGKDSVDHAPRAHDDIANSVAGALVMLAGAVQAAGGGIRGSGPFGGAAGGGARSIVDHVSRAY